MGVNPVRFAVAVSGGLACLMLGLLAGVSAGSSETDHVMSVATVTTTDHAQLQAAADRTVTLAGKVRTDTVAAQQQHANVAARTVTETVTRTVTGDPVSVTVTAPRPPDHHHGDGPGHGHGPGGGDGGDGPGGDGGGEGGGDGG